MMPKRCGHTAGKEVVDFDEALKRIKAAIDARKEGADILIMARTDARATRGLEEALERCKAFSQLGADITFLEAPQSEEEMRSYCENVPGLKMANLIENGKTPLLPMGVLHEMGFKIAVYALTLLNASIGAMQQALTCLKQGMAVPDLMDFQKLQRIVGFDEYDAELGSYHSDTTGTGESKA
jgi:2-methylisocitrate lyase-like PEP mutase family enzyme